MASDDKLLHIDGVDYPLVLPVEMTLGEQRQFERIADAGIDKIDDLETNWRTGIVVAWMAVSMKRKQQNTSIDQIVARLDDMLPSELQAAWADAQGGQSPPSIPASSDGTSVSATNGDAASTAASELTPGITNLNGSGGPGSDTGLPSAPETSEVSHLTS